MSKLIPESSYKATFNKISAAILLIDIDAPLYTVATEVTGQVTARQLIEEA